MVHLISHSILSSFFSFFRVVFYWSFLAAISTQKLFRGWGGLCLRSSACDVLEYSNCSFLQLPQVVLISSMKPISNSVFLSTFTFKHNKISSVIVSKIGVKKFCLSLGLDYSSSGPGERLYSKTRFLALALDFLVSLTLSSSFVWRILWSKRRNIRNLFKAEKYKKNLSRIKFIAITGARSSFCPDLTVNHAVGLEMEREE